MVIAGLFILIQLLPYGRDHDNPPTTQEPAWDSPKTRELAKRACFDCHSNETRYPWYSHVAPVSWLLAEHIEDGRRHLNFSEWHRMQKHAGEAAEMVEEGEMPLNEYVLLHKEADLNPEEKAALISGLTRTLGRSQHDHDHDHDHSH